MGVINLSSEEIGEAKEIDIAKMEGEKRTWTKQEKTALDIYNFVNMIKFSLEPIIGKHIEDVVLAFVPPEHPDRRLFDMGWRILLVVDEEDIVLMIDPTAAYSTAFMSAEPEDIKYQRLLDEINSKYSAGRVKILKVKESEENSVERKDESMG